MAKSIAIARRPTAPRAETAIDGVAQAALVVADAALGLLLRSDAVLVTRLASVALAARVDRYVGMSGGGCRYQGRGG